MFIQNYEDLDGACREQVEFLGDMAKVIMVLDNKNPHKIELIEAFNVQLISFSQRLNRPIEIATVNGEVWINIRDNTPIPKETIKAFLELKPQTAVLPAKMTERIQVEWKW